MPKPPKLTEFKGFKVGDKVRLKIKAAPEETARIATLNHRGEFSVSVNRETWKPIWADEMEKLS